MRLKALASIIKLKLSLLKYIKVTIYYTRLKQKLKAFNIAFSFNIPY